MRNIRLESTYNKDSRQIRDEMEREKARKKQGRNNILYPNWFSKSPDFLPRAAFAEPCGPVITYLSSEAAFGMTSPRRVNVICPDISYVLYVLVRIQVDLEVDAAQYNVSID